MSRLRAYAQLVRLPNVFTAQADIALGVLAARSTEPVSPPSFWIAAALLMAASACLYAGGMVWNDFFDRDQDRRERPGRPLPSGRVSPGAAARFGSALLVAGIVFAAFAGWRDGRFHWAPVVRATLLVLAILLYDARLKRTWAGPLGMGVCRFLNVLLGLSVTDGLGGWGGYLAMIVGLYIVGVTWFARTEARISSQSALAGAALVMLCGLFLALALPVVAGVGVARPRASPLFPYLLIGLGFLVGIPVCQAVARPGPQRVQAAVKQAIMGLVVLDAVLATALIGSAGLVILLLLVPALYLGRWIYST